MAPGGRNNSEPTSVRSAYVLPIR